MGWPFGELVLSEKLEELSKAVRNYYGAIADVENNLRTPIPEPPDALVLVHQMRKLAMPLVQGAIVDQPYIWMKEYKICVDLIDLFDALRERNRNANKT